MSAVNCAECDGRGWIPGYPLGEPDGCGRCQATGKVTNRDEP